MLKTFLLGIIAVCFLFVFSIAFAQEATPLAPLPTPSPIDYNLPYPGILPNHPLYIFKKLRDFILLSLISKPIRKVEFYILLSDKQLVMGEVLVQNKSKQAPAILNESVQNLEHAEKLMFEIPLEANAEVANTKDRFERSIMKHVQVISALQTSVTETEQQSLHATLLRLIALQEEFSRKK